MSFLEAALIGRQIEAVHADTEVTYLMLADGTQITIRGIVVVQPAGLYAGSTALSPAD